MSNTPCRPDGRRPRVPLTLRAVLTLVALFATLAPGPLLGAPEAADLAGHWQGAIELPGTKLAFDLDFRATDAGLAGDISIPLQNAKDLPLTGIAIAGESATFAIAGVPGDPTFRGTVSTDGVRLSGQFTQGGGSFPFAAERTADPGTAAVAALDGFDAFADAARVAWEVPGAAIAIVRGGQVIYAKGFGLRDVDGKLPVTPDTLFAIGSCTKAFTTFVLGTLVDEGKLSWDQPVGRYLPEFRMFDRTATEQMTARDLVTHRSGLPRHDLAWYNNLALSRADLVARLPSFEPSQPLRAKFQYNNLMYLTAGYLAERLTGGTWEQAVRARILEPLDMRRTVFTVEDMQRDADHAAPYEERDGKVVGVPMRPITNMGPAGSIDSSVAEMARWVAVHLGDGMAGDRRLIQAPTLADIHSPQMVTGETAERPEISQGSYGLGWFVYGYRGHQMVEHGGNIDGFSALVTLLPNDDLGLVVLVNEGGSALPRLLTRHAADRILGLPAIDWNGEALARRQAGKVAEADAKAKKSTVRKAGTKPSHPLADYAGSYEHPGYGRLDVALDGGRLVLTYNGIAAPLEHWHYDVFAAAAGAEDPAFEDLRFVFRTDVAGYVASLEAPFEPSVRDISFARSPDARLSDLAYLARVAGAYELSGRTITIAVAGDRLTATVPGQPTYHLEPVLGGEYELEEAKIVHMRFVEGKNGAITALESLQPEGVFTAKRKE